MGILIVTNLEEAKMRKLETAPFDKADCYYKEAYNSQNTMGAAGGGLFRMNSGEISVDPYTHDEFAFILDGEAELTDLESGKVYVAKKGDAVHISKGTRAMWETKKGVRLFFVTHPPF